MKVARYVLGVSTAAVFVAFSPCGGAQTLVRSVNGPAAGAQFGKACIVVPDQNSDGYKDLLVGAPGFNQERGAIYCISGAFLATGAGTQTLWTCTPTANQGDRFGTAIAYVDDATGDGVGDFLVGQPGYDTVGSNDRGAVRLVSGSSLAVLSLIYGTAQGSRMGTAIAATGSLDTDQRSEVLVGSPGDGAASGAILYFANATLSTSGPATQLVAATLPGSPGSELGTSLAAGFNYQHYGNHGSSGFIAGAPGYDAPGAADCGKVVLGHALFGQFNMLHGYVSGIPGERLGAAVDAAHDYDGDGLADYVVGAPNSPNGSAYQVGRTVVISRQRILSQTPPYEIHTFPFGSVAPPVNHGDPLPNFHFGAAVRACADLNNDGVGDILVGAPEYFSQSFSGFSFRGMVRIYSGATGARLSSLTGATTDRLGEGLGGAVNDLNGDGFKEFVVAGALSDAGGTDSGVVKCYQLFPLAPSVYCVGKLNSLGCTPAIGFSGSASANASAPFSITATNLVNQKNGLLMYAYAPTTVVFQGGVKCVANPTVRTPSQNSGGATSGSSCTGAFSFDFNAWFASGFDPALSAGSEIFAQYWSRDPASASHTSLSNALRFVINP